MHNQKPLNCNKVKYFVKVSPLSDVPMNSFNFHIQSISLYVNTEQFKIDF
jgi:hypothetical protein